MALTGDPKHFLNQSGVEYIWRTYIKPQFESLDLSDYPNTHFLADVISAIDEVKADKADVLNYYPIFCQTAAATATKVGETSQYWNTTMSTAHSGVGSLLLIALLNTNTANTALTLNINSTGAKPIYINGTVSSATNYTLPAGSYIVYYDGSNYYFDTTGKIPGPTSSSSGSATLAWVSF